MDDPCKDMSQPEGGVLLALVQQPAKGICGPWLAGKPAADPCAARQVPLPGAIPAFAWGKPRPWGLAHEATPPS